MRIFSTGHRRRMIVLALVVAGMPCMLLLVFASRVLDQERELRLNRERERSAEMASALAEKARQEMDRVRLAVSAGLDPHLHPVLIAPRHGSSLDLPWVAESLSPWPSSASRRAIDEGERLEFTQRDPAGAIERYQHAIVIAGSPGEKGYARLMLARALNAAGKTEEALASYREIAGLPASVHDEHRVPLALYALERLVRTDQADLATLVHAQVNSADELPASALHLLADLAAHLELATVSSAVDARLIRIQRGNQLQREIDMLLPSSRPPHAIDSWVPFGDWLWFVGSAWKDGRERIITIDANDVVAAMVADDLSLQGLEFEHGWVNGLELAGAALPGVSVRLPASATIAAAAPLQQRDYFLAALLVVLLTSFFAAWLLLRDVRREVAHVELRSQFVASVSHELKTPLSAIRMFAESLHMGRPADPERRGEYLDVIVNESERLSRLLDNVLEFAKIERGERRYHRQPHDLGQVVRKALHGAAYPLQQRKFKLAVHIEEDLPAVRLDQDAIEQAVLNLLTNAMKYSGNSRDLQLRVEGDGDCVALRVIDHGIGIPVPETNRIFEKFYRATNSGDVTGAGLGLAIVGHVVQMHGARLDLQSEPGIGSRFSILFPAEAD